MTVVTPQETEFLPGYTTTERIGAGGYGEVWRAEAPGGFEKAIKVVYGFHDDERATRELKALERIKHVRHPFLLSIERAEIVDGRLAILTELADMSLDRRFEQCRDSGLPGIPREELLGYIRDAADALDFLLQQHTLQHLDVKPENLLLVAGHIKVADFGLVKDITERTQQSLVGGMTPTYAAPELFDGRPSPHSDQYSLAILYQEMLTGALPFPGRTSAQLALQHTQSRPLLAPLPEHDRPIVARALSKNPSERFGSCLEFVEALTGSRSRARMESRPNSSEELPASNSEATVDTQAISSSVTECISPAASTEKGLQQAAGARHLRTEAIGPVRDSSLIPTPLPRQEGPLIRVSTAVKDAPLPEALPTATGFRPTLFVGIGGVGARVLAMLRHKLATDQGADWSAVLPMLLVDTDRGTIQAAQNGALGGLIGRNEACHIPLRRPQQYRSESLKLLNWLSRRWLYNIPRSLQTRGIRPLGRLALIDHSSRVQGALEEKLSEFLQKERIDEVVQTAGVECRSRVPRVILIASTDGGTGGGTAVDLAFAIESLGKQLGLDGLEIIGIFTHATGRKQDQSELALANTYSVLGELSTIQRTGYRGSRPPDARTACFEGDALPYNGLYFVHLGDDLSDEQCTEGLEGVADYLYLDAISTLGAVLDHCRREGVPPIHDDAVDRLLRSFSLSGLGEDEDTSTLLRLQPRAVEGNGHTRRVIALAAVGHRLLRASEALRRQSPPITAIAADVPHPVLVYEAKDLSLVQVAARLIDGRPDVVEVADRLHTRNDIAWQPLPRIDMADAPLDSPV